MLERSTATETCFAAGRWGSSTSKAEPQLEAGRRTKPQPGVGAVGAEDSLLWSLLSQRGFGSERPLGSWDGRLLSVRWDPFGASSPLLTFYLLCFLCSAPLLKKKNAHSQTESNDTFIFTVAVFSPLEQRHHRHRVHSSSSSSLVDDVRRKAQVIVRTQLVRKQTQHRHNNKSSTTTW